MCIRDSGRDPREENRAFERDRDERNPAVIRAPSDVQRVADHRSPVLKSESEETARDTAEKDEERHARRAVADRVVQLLDGVGRVGLDDLIALFTGGVDRMEQPIEELND